MTMKKQHILLEQEKQMSLIICPDSAPQSSE